MPMSILLSDQAIDIVNRHKDDYGSIAAVVEVALINLDETSSPYDDPMGQDIIRHVIEEAEQDCTPPREWNSAEVHTRHQKQWEEKYGKPWPL